MGGMRQTLLTEALGRLISGWNDVGCAGLLRCSVMNYEIVGVSRRTCVGRCIPAMQPLWMLGMLPLGKALRTPSCCQAFSFLLSLICLVIYLLKLITSGFVTSRGVVKVLVDYICQTHCLRFNSYAYTCHPQSCLQWGWRLCNCWNIC